MWPREEVVRVLRARGELWNVAPGVTALRGDAATLLRSLERAIAAICEHETCDDWRVPPAIDFARALDLDATVAAATDPFFAPSGRAKHLLQQLKELKRELLLPTGPQGRTAASSFNLHDTFFGEAFDIRLVSGEPATTACVAFGLERWLLAFLVRHGPHAVAWPAVDVLAEVRHG